MISSEMDKHPFETHIRLRRTSVAAHHVKTSHSPFRLGILGLPGERVEGFSDFALGVFLVGSYKQFGKPNLL